MANPKFRDTLKTLLQLSGAIAFERFDSTISPVSLDDPGAVGRTLADAEVLLDGQKKPMVTPGFSSIKNLITRINVRYTKVIPLGNTFNDLKTCRRIDDPLTDGGVINNFLSQGNKYAGYLAQAYSNINEDRPLTLEADGIRDEATAEALAKLIIAFRYKQLAMIRLSCKYTALDIELGDKIGINLTSVRSILNSYTYLVTEHAIQPNVGSTPNVDLTLLELGSATIADVDAWQDGGVGEFKQDGGVGDSIVDG